MSTNGTTIGIDFFEMASAWIGLLPDDTTTHAILIVSRILVAGWRIGLVFPELRFAQWPEIEARTISHLQASTERWRRADLVSTLCALHAGQFTLAATELRLQDFDFHSEHPRLDWRPISPSEQTGSERQAGWAVVTANDPRRLVAFHFTELIPEREAYHDVHNTGTIDPFLLNPQDYSQTPAAPHDDYQISRRGAAGSTDVNGSFVGMTSNNHEVPGTNSGSSENIDDLDDEAGRGIDRLNFWVGLGS